MLVLSRKTGEKVVIGSNITVTVVEVKGNRVRLAFEAPGDVKIMRSELIIEQEPTEELHVDPDLAAKPAEWQADHDATVQPTYRVRRLSHIIPHHN